MILWIRELKSPGILWSLKTRQQMRVRRSRRRHSLSPLQSWLISRRFDDFVDPSIRIAQDHEVQSEHGTDETAPHPNE